MKQHHLVNTVYIHTTYITKTINTPIYTRETVHTSITSNSTLITPLTTTLITTLINAAHTTMFL